MTSPPEKAPRPACDGTEGETRTTTSQIVSQCGQSRKEFSATLGVSERSVTRYRRAGKLIVTLTPGGKPRFHGVRV